MEKRFIVLAILGGIFLIVALPVGIAFMVFVGIYYYASQRKKDTTDEASSPEQETAKPAEKQYPDAAKAFDDEEYQKTQERLK